MSKKLSSEDFINRAKDVHDDKYDYSKVEYVNNRTKVCIICPRHGEFWQVPNSHLNGNGCPSCSGLKRMDDKEFIKRASEIHNGKYDYSQINFISTHKKVEIICPIHGIFSQLPKNHLNGQGCPQCGKKYAQEWRKNDYNHFIKESHSRFGNSYEFPDISRLYVNSHSKIQIKCKKCGNIFTKIACDHLTSPYGGCLNCYSNTSLEEEKIGKFIESIVGKDNVIYRDRTILNGREIDIYIPSMKLGIEYNGIYWHSEKYKSKNYHLEKTEECFQKGVKLIQIFEDEFINHCDIVYSKLRQLLGVNKNHKIFGRSCLIKEITAKESREFLENNHIQGFASATIYLGAFYKGGLIGVMTFKKEKEGYWDLNRFATDINYQCVGVGGKLFKHFIRNHSLLQVKSFADRRWTININNNFYTNIGFTFDKYTIPDYRYVYGDELKRHHKFGFRKKKMYNKYNLPLSMTESEMANKLGLNRIWDCGLIKYVWNYEDNK